MRRVQLQVPVERTFAVIKPDAVAARHVGEILSLVELEGFAVRTLVQARPNRQAWAAFYAEHAHRPFYDDLCAFMASGPVVLLVLEAEDAVRRWREVMGATDPRGAKAGTVRHRFGNKEGVVFRNAVHGSDSQGAAEREQRFFFDPHGPGQAGGADPGRAGGWEVAEAFADRYVLANVVHNTGVQLAVGYVVDERGRGEGSRRHLRGPCAGARALATSLRGVPRGGSALVEEVVSQAMHRGELPGWWWCSADQALLPDERWDAVRAACEVEDAERTAPGA